MASSSDVKPHPAALGMAAAAATGLGGTTDGTARPITPSASDEDSLGPTSLEGGAESPCVPRTDDIKPEKIPSNRPRRVSRQNIVTRLFKVNSFPKKQRFVRLFFFVAHPGKMDHLPSEAEILARDAMRDTSILPQDPPLPIPGKYRH
uniref:Uncharacterized protein n=1 Tax=Branchiostoma floridae TaxID=7739 RepID=C3Z640_BRAFL|eukprot:XP_002595954.1 hypothetical protein BRAFLDRAFT_96725 [Branchiostoma floridae]